MDQESPTGENTDQEEGSLHAAVADESGRRPLRERYGLVLLLVLFGYVLAGFTESRLVVAANSILWAVLLLITLWSPGMPPRLRRLGVVATVVVLVTSISTGLLAEGETGGWSFLILAVAQFAAILAILNRIMRHETVTFQTVMGGVAAYALIAFVMASVFRGVDLLTNAAFLNGVVGDGDYTYFSFVTLTTVGYGDITPASDLAKRLAAVEAFIGQVFLVTLVARLVSLWRSPVRG